MSTYSFKDFALWATMISTIIEKQDYKMDEADIDVLAGMYRCGMNPLEAAMTFTASSKRILTQSQLNYKCIAAAMQLFEKHNTEFIYVIGMAADGKFDMVKGPMITNEQVREATEQATAMFKKMKG